MGIFPCEKCGDRDRHQIGRGLCGHCKIRRLREERNEARDMVRQLLRHHEESFIKGFRAAAREFQMPDWDDEDIALFADSFQKFDIDEEK